MPDPKPINLMEALRKSLESINRPRSEQPARESQEAPHTPQEAK